MNHYEYMPIINLVLLNCFEVKVPGGNLTGLGGWSWKPFLKSWQYFCPPIKTYVPYFHPSPRVDSQNKLCVPGCRQQSS